MFEKFFKRQFRFPKPKFTGKKRLFSKYSKRYFCMCAIICIPLIICIFGAYMVNAFYYDSHFLPGTIINNVDVSDLNDKDSRNKISNSVQNYKLIIRFREGRRIISELKPELRADMNKMIEEQNRYEWLPRELGGKEEFSVKYSIDKNKVRKMVMDMPEVKNGVAPENAKVMLDFDNQYYVVAEKEGTLLDKDKLIKLIVEAVENGVTAIDLEKEHIYVEPKIRMNDPKIQRRLKKLKKFAKNKIVLKRSDGTEQVLDFDTTKDWINGKEGYRLNEKKLNNYALRYMKKFAAEDDTYGYYRDFRTTNYGMKRFETENLHGHQLNQTAMAKAIVKMLREGGGTLKPIYLSYIDDGLISPDLYVEVDIDEQHVYVYKNDELIFDCNCVSGNKGSHDTPTGIFDVEEKEAGRRLEGYNSYGERTYSVWVNYWISFYPHYGLHDASWRDEFGGDIYEYDGSHGCVNLSRSSAATIYDIVDYGTPVIIFRNEE